MRVYLKKSRDFVYPEAMQKILNHLKEHGTLYIEDETVEEYYFIFSDEKYSAGWIGVSDQTLEEFADYLSELDI